MGDRESMVNLLVTRNNDGTITNSFTPKGNRSSDKEQLKRHTMNKTVVTALALILMFAVAICIICMGAMYIHQLHMREKEIMQIFSKRLDSMEQRLSSFLDNTVDDLHKMHQGMAPKFLTRTKRSANGTHRGGAGLEETEHIRNEHHGLASSNIALIYADPQALIIARNYSAQGPNAALRFRNTSRAIDSCAQVQQNENNELWCVPFAGEKDRFMLRSSNYYSYFVPAPWMSEPTSQENFQVTGIERKRLVVNKPGIYIVASNMHFTQVEPNALHYGVFARDSTDSNERPLATCTFSSNPADTQLRPIFPCPTWQLVSLNAGDIVYMKISGYLWFKVEKNSFFLALIKLNDWGL